MTKNGINSRASLKRFVKNFLLIFALVLVSATSTNVYSQLCYGDNCIDAPAQTTPIPGCCIATTAGMTTSYVGTYGCATLTGGNDVWVTFMAPSSGFLTIDFTAITIAGTVNMVVFDSFSNADNCATLNAGGVIAAIECFDAATPPNPITLNYVQAGERYFILISSPVGATPGTFEVCLDVQIPTGGMDCGDATTLCDRGAIALPAVGGGGGTVSGDGSNEDLDAGPGSADNQLDGSCFGSGPGDGGGEVNSQWYVFTCGQSGTLQMALNPLNTIVNCGVPTLTSDDYDFMLLDISKAAAPYYTCHIQDGNNDSATVVRCNWAGGSAATNGLTGWGSGTSYTSVFGHTSINVGGCQATDDFLNAGVPGAWTNTDANITCGRTYALMVSNYTGSTAGFNLAWGGTALFGVQPPAFSNPVASGSPACNVATTITAPLCGGALIWSYRYSINWGDGTTTIATSPNVTHSYTASGNYTITMIVSDPVGCQDGYSYTMLIDCPLPVELGNFTGFHDETKKQNRLDWYTYSETNSSHFIVESSADAIHWQQIGTVPAAGNSNTTKFYHLYDPNYYKLTYYRLKQIDYDGSFHVYSPISIKADGNVSTGGTIMQANIYPNPSDGMINITLPNDLPSYLVIYDMVGRQVFAQTLQGSTQHEVNLHELREGTYIVSIESAAGSFLQKLILN